MLNVACWRGDEQAALKALDHSVPAAAERGETYVLSLAKYVTALLYNGLARYELALPAARQAIEYDGFSFVGFALVEMVEAGVRSGAVDEARTARAHLQ